jgi:hypothetical protein
MTGSPSYIANAQTSVVGVSGAALAYTFALQVETGLRVIECNYASPLEINGLCPMVQRETGNEAGVAEKGDRPFGLCLGVDMRRRLTSAWGFCRLQEMSPRGLNT